MFESMTICFICFFVSCHLDYRKKAKETKEKQKFEQQMKLYLDYQNQLKIDEASKMLY